MAVVGVRGDGTRRLPVILPPTNYAAWLDPATPAGELKRMLVPHPADEMFAVPVVPLVNRASAEGPACLTPAA